MGAILHTLSRKTRRSSKASVSWTICSKGCPTHFILNALMWSAGCEIMFFSSGFSRPKRDVDQFQIDFGVPGMSAQFQ